MGNKNILSKYDLFATVVVTVVGTSLFSYPRVLSEQIGTDGWFVAALSGLVIIPFIYILFKMAKVNDYRRLTEILEGNLGKILGKIVAVYIALSGIFIISIEMRTFTEVLKMYLLDKTPTEFILVITIIVGSFLCRGEMESVIKFNEIAFWIMFIPIFITIPFVLVKADFTNVFPILNHTPIQYIQATKVSLYSFVGLGIIYMALPFVKDKKDIFKVTTKSILFIVGFYIIIFLTTIFTFPSNYNAKLLWPTMTMLSTVDIQGTFIERWEGIVVIFWIIFYFTTYVNILYFASELIRDIFRFQDVKVSLPLLLPIIYIIALYPQNIAEVYHIRNKIIPYIDTIIVGVLPTILLITGLKNSRRSKHEV